MNKFTFSFLLFLINIAVSAQSDCFKNCRIRSNACWENLKAKGITATDSALACDTKITEALKGCEFPGIQLEKFGGGKFNISELKGNVVFVHFWFTRCATCLAEMPSITKLSGEFKNDSVKFLAISFNDEKTLQNFFNKRGEFGSIQTFTDQKRLESEFCLLSGYPMNFVLDKNGKVIDAWLEENPEENHQEEFFNRIKTLILHNK